MDQFATTIEQKVCCELRVHILVLILARYFSSLLQILGDYYLYIHPFPLLLPQENEKSVDVRIVTLPQFPIQSCPHNHNL